MLFKIKWILIGFALFDCEIGPGNRKKTKKLMMNAKMRTKIKLACQVKWVTKKPPMDGPKAGDKEMKGIAIAKAFCAFSNGKTSKKRVRPITRVADAAMP